MSNIDDSKFLATLTVGEFRRILQSNEDINKVTTGTSAESDIMTIDEVAELTGYSKATLYKFTHERRIPFYKPAHGGRRLYFVRAEVIDWMQKHPVQTTEDYCNEKLNHF
ncbi:MAG: helix-turn-helix domain-containing protein [Alistipes sp.]|nr:helix-turn-helix domain-containing protein [Alistipes sp.]